MDRRGKRPVTQAVTASGQGVQAGNGNVQVNQYIQYVDPQDAYDHLGRANRSARTGKRPVIVAAAALAAAATIVTSVYVLSQPGLSAADRQFVSDMRDTFTFSSSIQDSDIASSGEKVCRDRRAGASVAREVSAVSHAWTNTTAGGAIQIIVLAEKDICAAERTAQTVTYVVTGSPADVTYGPTGSQDQGSVPMSVTQSLGSPQYYAIAADLQGGGSVSCQIKIDGVTIASASASGGYDRSDCEIFRDRSRSWVSANSE